MPRQTASLPALIQNVCAEERARDSDRQLLTRFIESRDESAFAALLERHGPTLAGLCRRWAGDADLADDVVQATFLVLARRAKSIRRRDSLASWLFGVARRIARQARLAESARTRREQRVAAARAEFDGPSSRWGNLLDLLDQELQRLPERFRLPLLLCYLQGRPQDEASAQLGWSLSTLRRRLEQGRDLLHKRLTRQGAALGIGLASGLFVPKALTAEFRECVCSMAFGVRPISTTIAALASGEMNMFRVTKLVIGLSLAIVLGASVAGIAWQRGVFGATPRPANSPVAAAPAADDPPAAPAKPTAVDTLRIVVLDPQGKPLPGADIFANISTSDPNVFNSDYKTDAAGVANVKIPERCKDIRLWVGKTQLVTMYAGWDQEKMEKGTAYPTEYTFRLERAVSAGGRIVDEQGQPIVGAKVQVQNRGDAKPAHDDGRMQYGGSFATSESPAITDADGRWRVEGVPNHPKLELSLMILHPDFVSDERWGENQKANGVTTTMLLQQTATLTLKRGVIVRGQVIDPVGKPIKDALVIRGSQPDYDDQHKQVLTDAEGRFRLPAVPPRQETVTVIAPGWAPQLRQLDLQSEPRLQIFRMAPGKTIRLRIVDRAGQPLPRAYVGVREWKGTDSLGARKSKIPSAVNADGFWEWKWAPDDPVKFEIYNYAGKDFAPRQLEIAGGAPMQAVTLTDEHRVTGRVTDAVTGKPIPVFSVIPVDVFYKSHLTAERNNGVAGKGGQLSFLATRTDIPLRLRVEAMGYRSQDGPEFRVGDDAGRRQDFRLQPSPPLTGIVLDAAGKPVEKAEVMLATPTQETHLSEGGGWPNHTSVTDATGRFAFPDPGEPWVVIAQADAGFAKAEFRAEQHNAGTLRLRPWASIHGRYRDGGRAVSGAEVSLWSIEIHDPERPSFYASQEAITNTDGDFEFRRVPPIPVRVSVRVGPWEEKGCRSGPTVPLNLQPGQSEDLDLGGAGAVVTGKVRLTGRVPADLNCTYSINNLISLEPGLAPPPEIAAFAFDIRKGWRDSWDKSPEGRAYTSTLRSWFVKLAPDGAFQISGVPAGKYDLTIAVYAKPTGCLVEPQARKVVRVNVTAADVASGELKLPEIETAVVPIPTAGDVPTLAFKKLGGGSGTLADCRGRLTLVHFWASWCGPCKKQLPAVRQLNERFGKQGLAVLGLSLDDDRAAWQSALKQIEFPWPQGRLAGETPAGVSSVPMYWLLDAEGKLIATTYDLDELSKRIAAIIAIH